MNHIDKDYQRTKLLDFNEYNPQLPAVGIFDEPVRCYKINTEWASIVMGMVSWLTEPYLWGNDKDERFIAIQEISRFLQGMECVKFELRQNPTNACIIEQSLDGGQTWSNAFDLSLCSTIVDDSDTVINQNNYSEYFNNVFQDVYNNFVNNYVNSPSDIHPDLTYGGGLDSELNAAYCNAVFDLVVASADIAVDGINAYDEGQGKFNVFLAMAGFVLAAIAIAGSLPTAGGSLVALAGLATWWGPVIGVTGGVANNLLNQWQSTQIAQYQDEPAQFEVVCYIVDNLSGASNTQATMLSTLQNHTLTDNAAVIADNLAILLEADATYAAFLEKWNYNLEFAEAGIELFCPCEIGAGWCNLFDFTVSDQSFVPRPDLSPSPGQYLAGQGWGCTQGTISGIDDNRSMPYRDFGVAFTADTWSMEYKATASGANANAHLIGWLNGALVFVHNFGSYNTDGNLHTLIYNGTHTVDAVSAAVVTGTGATLDADAYIHTRLQIEGTTGNPPVAENC